MKIYTRYTIRDTRYLIQYTRYILVFATVAAIVFAPLGELAERYLPERVAEQVAKIVPKIQTAEAHTADIFVFITVASVSALGSSWTVPADWNSASNSIETIGGGGGSGDANTNTVGHGGGGGGGYSRINNLSLTAGNTVTFGVGASGSGGVSAGWGQNGGHTWFNAASFVACTDNTLCVKAEGGAGSEGGTTSLVAGLGGNFGTTASAVGTTRYAGGNGGAGCGGDSGGGGGGAAGPNGDGAGNIGGAGAGDTSPGIGGGGGGGGGGSNGLISADETCASAATPSTSGAGGNNYLGTGSGAGVTSGAGTVGTNGGGGAGGFDAADGGNGGDGDDWTTGRGSGGGAGGGGDGNAGGQGGKYGGGGGGGDTCTAATCRGGDGIIVIKYQPRAVQSHFQWFNDDYVLDSMDNLASISAEDIKASGSEALEINNISRVRFQIANLKNYNSAPGFVNHKFRLEMVRAGTSCLNGGLSAGWDWKTVPLDATLGSHAFDIEDSTQTFVDGASTSTSLLSAPTGATTFTNGYGLDARATSGFQTIAENNYTEMEWALKPNSNANTSADYCFRAGWITDAGTTPDTRSSMSYSKIASASVGVESITVSGTCKQNDQATDCSDGGANHKVRVAVNGILQSQVDDTVDGSWSIASVPKPTAGQIVTVFIEGETASSSQAVAVTQWDSGNITGVELIEAHLTVGSDQRNNISNTDLGDYDSSVSGKMTFHDVNAGALTVDVDAKVNGEEIYVKGGNTYQPDSSGGDTVNTHDIEINGTFDLDSNVVAASGSWDNNGLFIANTGSVSFTGIGAETVSNVASGSFASHFNHFKIDSPGGTGTLTLNDTDVTASGQVKIETGDTLSIASGRKLTQTGSTLVLNGTISGAGRFVYRSATAFPTAGTVSSILVFDAQDGDQTMSNRTYGGQVEVTNNSTTTARNVTMSASTHTLSSNLYVIASTSQNITLVGATNDPTVNITGDLDYTGTAAGSETITSGAGTWTVSGNVNFTDGTFTTEAGNTLIMDGSSKTLTSNAQTLQNLTLSGTITLANAIHTAAGDFSMAGGTITAGTSTVTMTGTANTLTGGGNTLNSLTIDPSSAGTITMQTSNLTVSGTLTITASDKFKIESGRTLTLSGTGTPLSVSGTFEPDDGSTVQYTGSTATVTGTTFGALTLGGTGTYTLPSSSPTIKGNLVVTSGATVASGSATLLFRAGASQSVTDNNGTKQNLGEIAVRASTSGDTTLTLGSAIKIASATIDASQILNADGANTITISSISSPFTVNGTFQPRTGTVQYTGISANIAATKYNNLTLGGAGTYTLPSSGTTTLLGDLVVTSGATVASGSSTLFFREGGSQSVTDNNSTKQNLGEIAVQASTSGNTTLTLASDVRVASVTLDASQTLNANGSNTLTITNADSGGGRPLTASGSFGTFTPSTGTVVFTGNGATSIPVLDYNDLKIQPSANSVTHTFLAGTASVSKTFTVGNGINTGATVTAAANSTGLDVASVSISANTTLTAHASNEFAVGGHWVNNGSFTHSSGTVTFENPRTSSISGVTTFNNLTSTTAGKKIKFGAGQIFTFAGTLTVTGASGNTIKIESTASASQWLANFNNAQSGVTYATIIDSGCNGGTANLTLDGTSVNGGNNGSCWVFPGAAVVENPYTKTQGLGGGASVGGTSGGGIQQTGGTGQGTGGGASEGGGSGGGTPVPPPPGGGGQGTGGGASPVMFDTSWLLGLITWVTQPSSIKF